jgi:hypothetical protein
LPPAAAAADDPGGEEYMCQWAIDQLKEEEAKRAGLEL